MGQAQVVSSFCLMALVKKRDARIDVVFSFAIKIQMKPDVCFNCFSLYIRFS